MKTGRCLLLMVVSMTWLGVTQAGNDAPPVSSARLEADQPTELEVSRLYRERFVTPDKTNFTFGCISGRQIFDGLPFQIGGRVWVYGRQEASSANKTEADYPDIIGIPVNQKIDELHLLHGARFPDVEGREIASIRLNFADGSKQEFSIRYGGHVRDWQRLPSEEKETLTDPNSKIVWRGQPGTPRFKSTVRLCKTMLRNPSPEKVVTTLDVVSARHLSAYDLVAATVAKRDPSRRMTPPCPPNEPERHFDGKLTVRVVDQATGKPVAGALLNANMNVDDVSVIVTPQFTSEAGEAVFRYPVDRTASLWFSAEKEGYATQSSGAKPGETDALVMELERPKMLSGIVRGPDGQPAAGLEVRLVGDYSRDGRGIQTGADGKCEIAWNPRQFGGSDRSFCLLVRDPARNLAVAEDVDEDTGPLDLRLAPAMSVAGRAECGGKPLPNATAALVFWTGNSGMHLQGMAINTNTPGRFEIPALPLDRRYGLYVSAPGYGQKFVNTVDSDEAKRVEVDAVELKPANLKVSGQVLDAEDKPVSEAYVNLYGDSQPNGNARTDREGRFRFDNVCEGSVRLSASAGNSHGSVSVEGGDTNIVIRLGTQSVMYGGGAASRKLKGTVTDPEGKPVGGALVAVFPFSNQRWVKSGANGEFSLSYDMQPWQMQQGGDPCLVVRHAARELASSATIEADATNITVQLKHALTLTGQVNGPAGVPLANAQIGVWLLAGRTYSDLLDAPADTDLLGKFEIKNLPPEAELTVYAKAKDHGRQQQKLDAESGTNRVELAAFELKAADQVIAGEVVGSDEKPVSGIHVSLSGDGQPDGFVMTDSKGRFNFKVCEGPIRLFASGQSGYANTTVAPGDTNIVIQLTRSGSSRIETPRRASLQEKPLPGLASVGLAVDAAPTGQPLLLCLLDAEQRPSRRAARLLAERHDALKGGGVTVLAAQVAVVPAESLQAWTSSSPMPFAVGCVEKKSSANKWATDVSSLPWLILRDAQGKVAAEGFALDELDARLKELKK